MANMRIKLPQYEKSNNYVMSYHISALSDKRYRIAITDQAGNVLAETTHNTTQFEGCLGMDKVFINSNETELYLEIDSNSPKLIEHSSHNFSKNGASELYSGFFADDELNFYALAVHIIFSKYAS